MTQIRETIESLRRVLNYGGIADITAEVFRLAKYNRPEATGEMWISLKSLLLWTWSENHNNRILHGVDVVKFCKHNMYTKGYRSKPFFLLPQDMTRGSREILLAFGWLLATQRVIDKLMTSVDPFSLEDLPHQECDCQNNEDSICEFKITRTSTDSAEHILQGIHRIIWMKGRLNAACRNLLKSRDEYAVLLRRIHHATCPFPQKSYSSSHMSVLDVYLLSQPKLLTEYQHQLEKYNLYLQTLITLKIGEPALWKWMDSVTELKLKEEVLSESENVEPTKQDGNPLIMETESYRPSRETQQIKHQQVKLSKLLHQHELLYSRVCKMQTDQRVVLEGELRDQIQDILSSIEKEISDELTSKQTHSKVMMTTNHQVLKLISDNTTTCRSQEPSSPIEGSGTAVQVERITEDIVMLKQRLANLTKEQQEKILEISCLLTDIVCIPPHPIE